MKVLKKEASITKSKKEEKLKLILTELDIQKRKMEIEKEKILLEEYHIQRNIALEEQRVMIDKIYELRNLMSDITIDEDRTIFGSEPFIKNTYNKVERAIISKKLFELIEKF